jgi:hypothetical protein
MLRGELSVINDSLNPSKKRNHLYCTFVATEHGRLGHRIHICIPECVIAFIRHLVPSHDNRYTGHRDIGEEGNKTDPMDQSHHEDTNPNSNNCNGIDYANGEKVKITISFDNNQFDISHVHNFISQSPFRGWNVSFPGMQFTEAYLICDSEEMYRSAFVHIYCMMEEEQYTHITFAKVPE